MSSTDLCRVVLLSNGHVFFTATHVDVVMRLNRISLPLRCAGLDANPGWVRDLMRIVTFHFL